MLPFKKQWANFVEDRIIAYILVHVKNMWENEGNFNSTFHWYNSIPSSRIKAKFVMNYNRCSYTTSTFIIPVLLDNSKHATGRTLCYNSFSLLPIQIWNKSVRPPLWGIFIKQVTSCSEKDYCSWQKFHYSHMSSRNTYWKHILANDREVVFIKATNNSSRWIMYEIEQLNYSECGCWKE